MTRQLARFGVTLVAIWIVAAVVPGIDVAQGFASYVVIGLIFALVNVLVKPVLKLFSFPLLLLTLGLFLIVINAAMLGLTAALTDKLQIDGFGPAVVAALLISAVTWGRGSERRQSVAFCSAKVRNLPRSCAVTFILLVWWNDGRCRRTFAGAKGDRVSPFAPQKCGTRQSTVRDEHLYELLVWWKTSLLAHFRGSERLTHNS